jgi:hypothetical protein
MLSVDAGLMSRTKHSEFHHSLNMNPKSKLASELVKEAGVPVERLSFPVVTYYRHDQLLSKNDLERVMIDAEDRVEVKLDKDFGDWFGLWTDMLSESSAAVKMDASKEETNLIVLNTGSYWSTKSLGSKVKEEDVDAGYQKMVRAWVDFESSCCFCQSSRRSARSLTF